MARPLLAAFVLLAAVPAYAQISTGTIAGVVSDRSGAGVAGADVTITNQETGLERRRVTSEDGRFAAAILAPGRYLVSARGRALHSLIQLAVVHAGMTTTVDLVLDVDLPAQNITVTAASTLGFDRHEIGGWINRTQIEQQPLNGRNVLEVVKLEPGVASPERLPGGRVFIAPLGAGLPAIPRVGFTRSTLDGGNFETPGTIGSLLQISPDVVEQVQVSTVNFDLSNGAATSGAVNVITRSGGNRRQTSVFSLYRDQHWSSSPGEPLGLATSSPPFRRHQAGGTIGGPLRTNRAFFFAGYERHDQRDVITNVTTDPELQHLAGSFESPYAGSLFSGRIDVRVTNRHQAFIRHTHDANWTFTTQMGSGPPSGWAERPLRAHQTLGALTSLLSSNLVNDLRVSYYSTRQRNEPASASTCPAPCFGLGAPRIMLSDGGPGGLTFGTAATNSGAGQRTQVSDNLVWQRGAHLVRLGVDWEHTSGWQVGTDSDPVQMTLWTPAVTRQRNASVVLPASFATLDDVLRLPLRSFTTSVGSGEVLQRGFQPIRRINLVRVHAGDQWNLRSRLAINGGLAWAFEPGVLNDDLTKPDWLGALVGADGLHVPASHQHLSSTLGFAWRATSDSRTIVRGGGGLYFESIARTFPVHLVTERVSLSPLGTSRLVLSGANLVWNGVRLNFPAPTTFTGADLLAILPEIRSEVGRLLNPDNRNFSVVNLDRTKEGRNLYDPVYMTPRAVHLSIGFSRELDGGIFVGADLTWKKFTHTFINGIDYNRFLSAAGPVIPQCTAAQRTDVAAVCSNGSLFFDTTIGRARYAGLLVRIEKHFRGPSQILVSYALGSFVGSNGTGTGTSESGIGRGFGFNNDDFAENYGPLPTDQRHTLNVSGLVEAPWRLQVSFNLAAYSRAPFAAYVAGADFNGDGTTNDLLPGTRVNQFNRGFNRDNLIRLVQDYNARYAGKPTAAGQLAPLITLPGQFTFNDNFFALDLRVARTFAAGRAARFTVFADVFNVLNTENLTGYSGNLTSTSFGRPTDRVGQAFGSGGPRAGQIGVRFGF